MKQNETTIEFVRNMRVELKLPNVIHAKEIIEFLEEDHSEIILTRKGAVLITLHLFVVRDLMMSGRYFKEESFLHSRIIFNEVEEVLRTLGWSRVFEEYYELALDLLNEYGLDAVLMLIEKISQEFGKLCGSSSYLDFKAIKSKISEGSRF